VSSRPPATIRRGRTDPALDDSSVVWDWVGSSISGPPSQGLDPEPADRHERGKQAQRQRRNRQLFAT